MQASIQPFTFGQNTIRTLTIGDAVWFVATDVAEALGYRNAPDAARHLDDDEKGTQIVRTPGGDQRVTIINESGLYALVLRSRKPEARKFAKWVTGEVLPAIRKTGGYNATRAAPPSLTDRRWLISFDHLGNEQHLALDWNDCVIKYADLPALIGSGAIFDADLIARIGQACLAKLLQQQQASAAAAKQLRQQAQRTAPALPA